MCQFIHLWYTLYIVHMNYIRVTMKAYYRFVFLTLDYDDIGTKLSTKCQKNDTSLATPAIPLQSTSTRQATEEYEDYVNQGLGPVYYSSVKDGDYGNEYDYISDNPGSVVMMATNPAYQTTSHPNSTSGVIWDKKTVTLMM